MLRVGAMLSRPVPIFNVKDSEAFVRAHMPRVILTTETREDLVAEGLRILTEMSRRYQPGRGGQDPAGSSFSAYAHKFLPGKMRDAWHRMEGHTLSTLPDGGREWHYPMKGASLDSLSEGEGSMDAVKLHDGSRMSASDQYATDATENIGRALDELWRVERERALQVALLMADGSGAAQISLALGLSPEQVASATDRVAACLRYLPEAA